MKTIKLIGALVLVLAMASCQKNDSLPTSNEKSVDQMEVVQYAEATSGVKVECNGSCTGSEETCRLNGTYSGGVNTIVCSCEGCTMVITMGMAPVLDQDLLDNVEHVESHYEDYIENTYQNDEVSTNTIEVVNFQDDYVLIKYEYTNETEEFDSSVAFKVAFDNQGAVANKFVIDCSGGCSGEGESCAENFNVNTGNVSCTCEGSCNMTVTQLPSE